MATTGASRKRKQSSISKREDSTDDDHEYLPVRTKKARKSTKKTRKPKPNKEAKVFRFLELPAELRNAIYELTLTMPEGSFLANKTKHSRNVVRLAFTRPVTRAVPRSQLPGPNTALLRTSKMVQAEGMGYLYGQHLSFADHHALNDFLAIVGPKNVKGLRDLKMHGPLGGGSISGLLNMLKDAVHLRSLTLDCYFTGNSDPATIIWRALHLWLEAYGRVNGRKDAGVDIIKVLQNCFFGSRRPRLGYSGSLAEKQAYFYSRLRTFVTTS